MTNSYLGPRDTFQWPTIDARTGRLHLGRSSGPDSRDKGVLSSRGYRVGQTHGVSERKRRRILSDLFLHDELSDVQDIAYRIEWGETGSDARLEKLAHCLAAFARNALRKNHRGYRQAIREWVGDLEYLRETFHEEWMGLAWPSVELPEGWVRN